MSKDAGYRVSMGFPNNVDEFLAATEKEQNTVGTIVGGDKPDITAAQAGSASIVAASGLGGYAAGMRSVDLYVFLGCVTLFAIVWVLSDAFLRAKRGEHVAIIEASTVYETSGDES